MKKEVLSMILLIVCLTIHGQQVNQTQNRFRGDDAMERKQVQTNVFDLQYKDMVWSMEDMELSSKTFKTEYTTAGDTLTGMERGNHTYFQQTDKAISIIGSENEGITGSVLLIIQELSKSPNMSNSHVLSRIL